MSARTTLVLLAVLVVLGAVAFLVQGPCGVDRPRDKAAVFPTLTAGDVRVIRATTGAGAELLLSREGGPWRLGAAKEPADTAAADALLADLVRARTAAVVSTNAAKQTAYETDAGTGVSVRLESAAGKPVAAFVVGARGPDFDSCYLRREGAVEVLLVSPDFRTRLSKPADAWREPKKP